MNIIANDCVTGYIYKNHLKCQNQNPFIWSSIDLDNFCTLIENYNKINFHNIKCDLVLNNSGICKQGSLTPKIVIDNLIEVNYFHYVYDASYVSPSKIGPYTMYNDIIAYTVNAYKQRLDRMTEEPMFVWDVTKILWYNKEKESPFEKFKLLKTDFKIIIYQPNIENSIKNNIVLLNKVNGSFEVDASAKHIFQDLEKLKLI